MPKIWIPDLILKRDSFIIPHLHCTFLVWTFPLVQKSCCFFLFDPVTSMCPHPFKLVFLVHSINLYTYTCIPLCSTLPKMQISRKYGHFLCKMVKSQWNLDKNVPLKVAPMHHEECKILQYAPCNPDWGLLMVVFRMKVLHLHCKEDNVVDDRGSHTQHFCWTVFITNMHDRVN